MAGDARLAADRAAVLHLLRTSGAPFDRTQYEPGHVTASAVVVSPGLSRVLLVFHERLGRWLQPGGHVEPGDGHARAAAAREVEEETGVSLQGVLGAPLVGIDVHSIPPARGEPGHLHHDLCFLFVAASETVASGEGLACRWADDAALGRDLADASLLASVGRARHLLRVMRRAVFPHDPV